MVRAIRNGWIKPKQEGEGKPKYYLMWGKDDTVSDTNILVDISLIPVKVFIWDVE